MGAVAAVAIGIVSVACASQAFAGSDVSYWLTKFNPARCKSIPDAPLLVDKRISENILEQICRVAKEAIAECRASPSRCPVDGFDALAESNLEDSLTPSRIRFVIGRFGLPLQGALVQFDLGPTAPTVNLEVAVRGSRVVAQTWSVHQP